MAKISRVDQSEHPPREIAHVYDHTFAREKTTGGSDRLRIGVQERLGEVVRALVDKLDEPFVVLYVLHTSRTGAPLGRYQSPALSAEELTEFLSEYATFFAEDARHDVWIYSETSKATIVVDRHNLIYAYGPLDRFELRLRDVGLREVASWAAPSIPRPHALHYHPEWDVVEAALLRRYDWQRANLAPSDVQFWSGPVAPGSS